MQLLIVGFMLSLSHASHYVGSEGVRKMPRVCMGNSLDFGFVLIGCCHGKDTALEVLHG